MGTENEVRHKKLSRGGWYGENRIFGQSVASNIAKIESKPASHRILVSEKVSRGFEREN